MEAMPSTIVSPPRRRDHERRLGTIFDGHYERLCGLARLLGAEEEAEDVVSEAFCELLRQPAGIRDAGAVVGYLRGTVRNLIRMRIRHRQVVRKHGRSTAEVPPARSAEQAALVMDDRRAVLHALRALPSRQREAITLRFWLDLKDVEIATAMGISPGSVKVHIFRGLAGLKRILCEPAT